MVWEAGPVEPCPKLPGWLYPCSGPGCECTATQRRAERARLDALRVDGAVCEAHEGSCGCVEFAREAVWV